MTEKTIVIYFIGLLLSMDLIFKIYDKNIYYRDSIIKKVLVFAALITVVPYLVGIILLALVMW